MARLSRKKLLSVVVPTLIVLVIGGYFLSRSVLAPGKGDASAADSTADSTTVATQDEKGDEKKKKEPDPVPVEVAAVSPREISSYYYTTATLDPQRTVDILAKISGQVTGLNVEEGRKVEKDEVLCQIEDSEQRIALDEARINRDQQHREYERLEMMHDRSLISDKEFFDRKYQYELAQNRYEAAALKYEYTKIRAPFSGIITKRYVELGQNLTIGTQVFEIVDASPLQVRMYLPESEIRDIRVGQAVTIHPDNTPDRTLTGRIVRVSPEVDKRTGTVKVTAETGGAAIPGSFARIKILTDTRRGSLTIPRRGLISDAGDQYVYIAEADTVRRANVQIGYQDESYAEVLDGLPEGAQVVVVGMGGLRTGTKVRILDTSMHEAMTRRNEREVEAESASD